MNNLRMTKYVHVCMIFLIYFLNILPVQSQDSPDVVESKKEETDHVLASSIVSPLPQPQTSIKNFVAGDGLSISTFPDTISFLNTTLPIDDEGFVDFPIIGRINVTRMNQKQLESFIKENFREYIRSENVSVRSMLRISVIGGFLKPGLYYVNYSSSFWELIQMAGGPNHEEGLNDMRWERNGEEVIEELLPFYERGSSLKSMGFKSGDLIWTTSPGAKTTWDIVVSDVLPIFGLVTSLAMFYLTFQQTNIFATR